MSVGGNQRLTVLNTKLWLSQSETDRARAVKIKYINKGFALDKRIDGKGENSIFNIIEYIQYL